MTRLQPSKIGTKEQVATMHFQLPAGYDQRQVAAFLAGDCALVADAPVAEQRVLYDTFDWRLFRRSLSLEHAGTSLTLRRLAAGDLLHSASMASVPRLARELPDSELKQRLAPITEPRALLPVVCVQALSSTYRALNDDEKTVARLIHTEARLDSQDQTPAVTAYLTLQPLRGYDKEARQLQGLLESAGLQASSEGAYVQLMEAAGCCPGSYSSKIAFSLSPEMRSDEACRVILRQLLDVMRANEAGIKADVDIEFLHDYRIAVRRTRSALSQIRGVFSPAATEYFGNEFASLGRLSNPLRDLDVYLLAADDYRARLPDVMRADVDALFRYLRAQRGQALQRVVEHLDSADYGRLLQEWQAFLDEPGPEVTEAAKAAVPVADLARKRIYRRYRRVLKDGTTILADARDEQLHALRIDAKKLRYLMEFFASLFPRKSMNRLVKQLKRLQDNLGAFNDLEVQQAYLLHLADEIPLGDEWSRRGLVAIGFLVEDLSREQEAVKADFARIWARFAAPKNKRMFRKLFRESTQEGQS